MMADDVIRGGWVIGSKETGAGGKQEAAGLCWIHSAIRKH